MPRNNGIYEPPINNWNPAINDRPMDPAGWNALRDDIVAALTQSVSKDGQTKLTGNLDFDGHRIINLAAPESPGDAMPLSMLGKGDDIASASTITIPMAGDLFTVTGTTAIDTVQSTYDGKVAFLQFEDAVSLVNSPDLILPGGAGYLTTAGEVILFISTAPASGYAFPIMKPSVAAADVWAAVLAI